ncbi:MAG: hypothetical protein IPL52_09125 [Flavobacteriales bacterium]|nr:hypothetical protein [Flavobacteriales bacterium]
MLKLLIALTWVTPRTLVDICPTIDSLVQHLTDEQYADLAHGLTNTSHIHEWTRKQQLAFEKDLEGSGISDRLRFLLSKRYSSDGRMAVFNSPKSMLNAVPTIGRGVKLSYMIQHYLDNPGNEKQLESIRVLYAEISESDEGLSRRQRELERTVVIPNTVAQKIMRRNTEYPRIIASLAERACRNHAFSKQKAVGSIAASDRWFDPVQGTKV